MTNSPQTPPPSPEEQRIRQQLRKRIRQESTDEWIAIIVAFGTIGAILFWSLGIRRDNILSVGEGNIFLGSENIVGNNEDVDRLSLTDDELELGEPETLIIERETPTTPLQDAFSEGIDIEELEIERSGRLDNFLSTAPITGSVETEVETELEIEPEVPISESEIETELEIEPELETPEAIVPETEEIEPELETPEAIVPETEEIEPEVVPEEDRNTRNRASTSLC